MSNPWNSSPSSENSSETPTAPLPLTDPEDFKRFIIDNPRVVSELNFLRGPTKERIHVGQQFYNDNNDIPTLTDSQILHSLPERRNTGTSGLTSRISFNSDIGDFNPNSGSYRSTSIQERRGGPDFVNTVASGVDPDFATTIIDDTAPDTTDLDGRNITNTAEIPTVRDVLHPHEIKDGGGVHPQFQNTDQLPGVDDGYIKTFPAPLPSNPSESPGTLTFETPEEGDGATFERIQLGKTEYDPSKAYEIATQAQKNNKELLVALHNLRHGENKNDTPPHKKEHPLRNSTIIHNIKRLGAKFASAFSAFKKPKIDARTQALMEHEKQLRDEIAQESEDERKKKWGEYEDKNETYDSYMSDQDLIATPIPANLPTTKIRKPSFFSNNSISPNTKVIVENELRARNEKNIEEQDDNRFTTHKTTPSQPKKGLFSFLSRNKRHGNAGRVAERELASRQEQEREHEEVEWSSYLSDMDDTKQHLQDLENIKDTLIRIELNKLTERTREKRKRVIQEAGPERKKLIDMLDAGALYLEKNISRKTRLGMGIGLACAGAISLYAAPAIATVAAMTAVGVGARIVTAGATYYGIKRMLDSMIEKRNEKNPSSISPGQQKLIALAGAMGAAVVGNFIGEYLARPLGHVLQEYYPQVNESLFRFATHATTPSVTEIAPPVEIRVTVLDVAKAIPAPQPLPPLETALQATSIPLESLKHTVRPGETLWSIIKSTMENTNFESFNELTSNQKNSKIIEALAKLPSNPSEYGIESGNINKIREGTILDISKAFTK
jgi:hypothetical protein